MYGLISTETYPLFKTWGKMFREKVDLKKISHHSSWNKMFSEIFDDPRIEKTSDELTKIILEDSDVKMYPPPELLFNAFLQTRFDNLKVVILGQDPYFNADEAMGLSFSVPYNKEIPSSLKNIYKNMLENKHISKMPINGNLELWAFQGCLLLNTSLTVVEGRENINGHKHIWKWITDKIIKYISDNTENVVFVLWGAMAAEKSVLIDQDKHEIIISSHPSGMSANKPYKNYPPFDGYDHFGKINYILKKWGKTAIMWDLIT